MTRAIIGLLSKQRPKKVHCPWPETESTVAKVKNTVTSVKWAMDEDGEMMTFAFILMGE